MTREDRLLFEQAEKALKEAVDGVIEKAKQTNGEIVVWENGAVRRIPADQLPPATDHVAANNSGE